MIKKDDHPSKYHAGDIYRYFENFKRVNRLEHGRADEFNNTLDYEQKNCYMLSGKGCFLKCTSFISKKKTLASSISNLNYRIKEEQMLRLDVGYQNFAKEIKRDITLYDV